MSFYRRNLPHWQPEGAALFITWRLRGSLPRVNPSETGRLVAQTFASVQNVRDLVAGPSSESLAKSNFSEFDSALDKVTTGPLWLKNPRVAQSVVETIQKGETQLGCFLLSALVIMPNHVHILIHPHVSVAHITKGIKGASARAANKILRRAGKPFWQDESFDHWIRTQGEYEGIQAYIEQNPVQAGLVKCADEWPWSSANIAFKKYKEALKEANKREEERRTGRNACATQI